MAVGSLGGGGERVRAIAEDDGVCLDGSPAGATTGDGEEAGDVVGEVDGGGGDDA